ncbi:MAG: benzoyl-CoA-dihydrodiol lyase [Candidatus Eisenbacteria bacterium]|nr:benzoyl-CoA-dihydrodiol lyase [Candidatus Eisenbacteria bacterium]MCC7142963.1 benzoyl-CoA-dihydrodiol lyase [Candidatus Eisenbacteria bacterium]
METNQSHHVAAPEPIRFETDPSRYRHWKLSFDGPIATLAMDTQDDAPLRPGYILKLNSYDLGVDIELADAIQRLRFEHPEVRCLVVTSGKDRIFCAGANIPMLGSSSHAFKVNFCKYTNETRLYLEDLVASSGIPTLCAVNGICAGGGYELALACERILLVDDGNAAVSLPETPLLGVLPGTGGLTRVIDKRKIRRDRADVFSTLAEGIRGRRAEEWGLVDRVIPRSGWAEALAAEAARMAATATRRAEGLPLLLPPLGGSVESERIAHRHVTLEIDAARRVATIGMQGPSAEEPTDAAAMRERGADLWALRAFRELDDVLLHLRFNHETIGVLLLETAGEVEAVLRADRALLAAAAHGGFAAEVLGLMRRVLKRLDQTARSCFAIVKPGSCFAGSLFELALAADRSYALADPDQPLAIALSPLNDGALPMATGLSRLDARFYGEPSRAASARAHRGTWDAEQAYQAGLVTFAPDDIDWDDEVRIAIEERVSISPDALTGMEANLRWPGPETMETRIFGRLSAWQNWIFTRPNSTGERGALTLYGRPERPEFDWRRT